MQSTHAITLLPMVSNNKKYFADDMYEYLNMNRIAFTNICILIYSIRFSTKMDKIMFL